MLTKCDHASKCPNSKCPHKELHEPAQFTHCADRVSSCNREELLYLLTSVLRLSGDEIAKFTPLLELTPLNSLLSVAEFVVNRLRFIEEFRELVYGASAKLIKERCHLQKIVEGHTWIFGKQYDVMGSDSSFKTLLPIISRVVCNPNCPQSSAATDASLRDIPDLYLMCTKWNVGANYHQHLIIEMKRPSVTIGSEHVNQLKRYATEIVRHPMFSQQSESHRFTFILVSSNVSEALRRIDYQAGDELGMIGRPQGLGHPTELWALRWSDLLDKRTEEMSFLKDKITLQTNPTELNYLKKHVAEFLPDQVLGRSEQLPKRKRKNND